MNKRGNLWILVGFIFFMLLALGAVFIVTLGSGIITYGADIIAPELQDIGMIGTNNMTKSAEMTVGVANTSVQMLKWFSGVITVAFLIGMLMFAGAVKMYPSKLLIGIYFLMMILLIFTSIFISNAYEDIYNAEDDLGTELKEMGMASFLIIYLPAIITVIGFIGGIIIFSGIGGEEFT